MTRRFQIRWLIGPLILAATVLLPVRAERLPVRSYTSADGLGSSFVDYLMRDSHGFLWFCTRDGLSRFDGARFITYQIGTKDPPSGIEALHESRNGDYWISTTSGLYRYRSSAVSVPQLAANNSRPVLPAEFISKQRGAIFETRDGRLFFASGGLSAVKIDGEKVTLSRYPITQPPGGNDVGFYEMDEAADGSLWFNTSIGIERLLPDGRVVLYQIKLELSQLGTGMLLDAKGRVWVAHQLDLDIFVPESIEALSGLGAFTIRGFPVATNVPARVEQPIPLPERPGETLHFTPGDFLTDQAAQRFLQSRDGHIWLSAERELLEFDGRVFHRYSVSQGLAASMGRMAEDLAGNIWIGGHALIRLDRQSLRSYTEVDGLNSTNIEAITEAKDGTLFVANGTYYLSQLSGSKLITSHAQLPSRAVARWASRYAMIDSRNEVWIITREKLYRFGRDDLAHPLATYSDQEGLPGNEAYQLFEDRKGYVWVSQQPVTNIQGRGLARLEPGQSKFRRFTEADGYPPGKSPTSFAEDAAGNVWVGFYEGGFARFNGTRFEVMENVSGTPDGLLTDILIDRRGRLWLTSSTGGVGRLDDLRSGSAFVTYTTGNGLSSNNARTITEDQLGNIYVGTVRGVDRISADGERIKHFSVSDGLAGDFVADSLCDQTGIVWFATTNGLSRLVPAIDQVVLPPQIWLGGLSVAGVAQPVLGLGQPSMALPDLAYNQNTLQLDFFGLDFRPGEGLRYQYKLEGAGQDWSLPSEQRTVTLANLQSGSYRFLVRAVNSDGQSSLEPATVTFRILPPLWLRWWFRALVVLLVVGAIVLFYRYRIARLREVNTALQAANRAAENLRLAREERLAELQRVRSRIATDLHDDIGASLTQIAILSEVAQQQHALGNGAVAQPLEMIYDVSSELVGTMSDIVWAINPSKDHLPDLTQRMRRFASDVLSAKEIDFEFIAPATDENLALGANIRREVFLIFKESVNNIVKHSGASLAAIEFQLAKGNLRLRVTDNGAGFVVQPNGKVSGTNLYADQMGGNGLPSMQKRATDLGGNLSLESQPGHGTTVTLTLPVPSTEFENSTIQLGSDGSA
ncbi:MAG: ATP-binding protein [Pyrinomonadaceae bacterium]